MSELLREMLVPDDSEETEKAAIPDALLPDLYFVLVAVCHQTSPKGETPLAGSINGKNYVGWDFLRRAFMDAAERDPTFLAPERLADFSASDLERIVQIADAPVHLNAIESRAGLIRDLGARMQRLSLDSISQLRERCDGRLLGPDGLLNAMSEFHAYRDPIRKKTVFFLALMINHGLWFIHDAEHLPAPVDYHEVRGHLRCGTIVLLDKDLADRMSAGVEVSEEEDLIIRGAVAEAIASLASSTGLTQSRLHYLFWNVFRSCCKRDSTHCEACPSTCGLPSRYRALKSELPRCVFAPICVSRGSATKLLEHYARTDFY